MRDRLTEIASGKMTVEASDYRVLSILVNEAEDALKATSLVSPGFWNSTAGQNYWKKNEEALDRGVNITRIFVCERITPELGTLMGTMHNRGVDVLVAMSESVPIDVHIDFLVADERLVLTAELTSDMRAREHHISSKPEDVQKALSNFERLKWLAKDYESVSSQNTTA